MNSPVVRFGLVLLVVGVMSGLAIAAKAAECRGDISGFWEKRPPGGGPDSWQLIESFKVDSSSGRLEVCTRDRAWDSKFKATGESFSFVYARRMRVFDHAGDGTHHSASWIGEYQGVTSEYRVRAVDENWGE